MRRARRRGGERGKLCSHHVPAWGSLELERPTEQGQSNHVVSEIPDQMKQRSGPSDLQSVSLPLDDITAREKNDQLGFSRETELIRDILKNLF